jgi:alpha-L-glutamate ligase-like protein
MKVKPSHVLGMNARNQLYSSLNSAQSKRFGFSKYAAKEFLRRHGIGVAELYAILTTQEELREFDWFSIKGGFAVKPSNGSAGKGVLVIKEYLKRKHVWIDVEDREHTADDLRLHAGDILEGQYSTWGDHGQVIIEERIPMHPDMSPYAQLGTPDIRVIVYRKIPIMAMTRLPTKHSGGRANLDLGAMALGIDMGTGKSTHGVLGKKETFEFFPDSNLPAAGVQIPFWKSVLRTAVRTANATGHVYMGVDIFLHPEKGPMVAEVNSFPGLSIQIANRAGLRYRLEKVADLTPKNVTHAVRIGQALFAENYPATAFGEVDVPILAPIEEIEIMGDDHKTQRGLASINTGREWSRISSIVAEDLGLVDPTDKLWTEYVEGEGKAVIVEVPFRLHDRVVRTTMVVSKQLDKSKHCMQIGRRDLGGYLVGVQR